jgi:hypothetical protein
MNRNILRFSWKTEESLMFNYIAQGVYMKPIITENLRCGYTFHE